jgi:hypothetical protein
MLLQDISPTGTWVWAVRWKSALHESLLATKPLTITSYVIGHPQELPGAVVWIREILTMLGQSHFLPVILRIQRRE